MLRGDPLRPDALDGGGHLPAASGDEGGRQVGDPDLVERPARFRAMPGQDRPLARDVGRVAEEVAGVRVTGDQAQRLLLS